MSIDKFQGEHRWLSNFAVAEVVFEGATYSSVEHAYQAAKTILPAERREIQAAPTPGKARRLGQKVCLRPDWEDIKLDVMRDLLRQKFRIPEYRRMLLETGIQHLMENNHWHDTFWGVCEGEGLNHLGRLLMDIREEIRQMGVV
jgi:ribA/ribD-fused uncharacterized protein